MADRQQGSILGQIRALFHVGAAGGLTDGQLLERFVARRAESAEAATAAEAAFSALVDRHGPMVWGVCRRALGDAHEAEDAFQATFLLLARKAGSIRVDDSLGRWLYGVACKVAARARSDAQRRRSSFGIEPPASTSDPVEQSVLADLRAVLVEELGQLPAKYRAPVELCHLQGMTHDEAARQLGWPVGTIRSRLSGGRSRLRSRLTRRGLAPSATLLASALDLETQASLAHNLVRSTIRIVMSPTPDHPELISASVAALVEGVSSTMILTKVKLVGAVVLATGFVATTAGVLAGQGTGNQQPPEPTAVRSPNPIVATSKAAPAAPASRVADIRGVLEEAYRTAESIAYPNIKLALLIEIADQYIQQGDKETARIIYHNAFVTNQQSRQSLEPSQEEFEIDRQERIRLLRQLAEKQATGGFTDDAINTAQAIPFGELRNELLMELAKGLAQDGDFDRARRIADNLSGRWKQRAFLEIVSIQAHSDLKAAKASIEAQANPVTKTNALLGIVKGLSGQLPPPSKFSRSRTE